MKILVTCKRVPDTDHKIRVLPNGGGVDLDDVPFVVNPFDAIAIEESLRIAETLESNVETVVIGIGTEAYEKELRTALAMGVDRAVLVRCDQNLDPWNVSAILEAVVKQEQPDLILMGKQAVDDDANQTGQFLAARLEWPQATFASKVEFVESRARTSRETDAGIEVVSVPLPAVITTDLRLNEPRYASLPSILKAKKKVIEHIDREQLGVPIESKVHIHGFVAASSERTCTMVSDVSELVGRLRDDVKILSDRT